MAALSTIIAGIGLAASVAGTAVTMAGQEQQRKASVRAERLREQQMNLESARQRRSVIRNVLRARAQALVGATAAGAAEGSGLQGGFGQIAQQGGTNMVGINQGQEIGAGIFAANRDMAGGQTLAAFGGGLSSLGGALFSGSESIGRVGSFATGDAVKP